MDFTFRNSVNHLGNNFEDKIHARSDEEFSKHYAQGLARYLAWHENLDLSSRKTAESMISPAGKVGLIQIIMNLLGQNFTGRCLNANSNDFKSLLHDNKDIEDYLKSIPLI